MKKFLLSLPLLICLGCGAVTTAPPPLAPGAHDAFDSASFETMASIRAFVQSAWTNRATLTSTPLSILTQWKTDTDIADALQIAYHNGSATQAQVQPAITKAQTDQTAYQNALGVK
jgi:hypothetical protein